MSYIHRNIQNAPIHNRHELGLRRWRELKMQAAKRARLLGARLIVLHEVACDTTVAQPLLVKDLAEPPAVVDMALGYEDSRQIF